MTATRTDAQLPTAIDSERYIIGALIAWPECAADALYTLDELNDRLGLGKAALRRARRDGLSIRRIGRRSYVLGSDLIEWFRNSARPT